MTHEANAALTEPKKKLLRWCRGLRSLWCSCRCVNPPPPLARHPGARSLCPARPFLALDFLQLNCCIGPRSIHGTCTKPLEAHGHHGLPKSELCRTFSRSPQYEWYSRPLSPAFHGHPRKMVEKPDPPSVPSPDLASALALAFRSPRRVSAKGQKTPTATW